MFVDLHSSFFPFFFFAMPKSTMRNILEMWLLRFARDEWFLRRTIRSILKNSSSSGRSKSGTVRDVVRPADGRHDRLFGRDRVSLSTATDAIAMTTTNARDWRFRKRWPSTDFRRFRRTSTAATAAGRHAAITTRVTRRSSPGRPVVRTRVKTIVGNSANKNLAQLDFSLFDRIRSPRLRFRRGSRSRGLDNAFITVCAIQQSNPISCTYEQRVEMQSFDSRSTALNPYVF